MTIMNVMPRQTDLETRHYRNLQKPVGVYLSIRGPPMCPIRVPMRPLFFHRDRLYALQIAAPYLSTPSTLSLSKRPQPFPLTPLSLLTFLSLKNETNCKFLSEKI